jgi:PRC-barrel domain
MSIRNEDVHLLATGNGEVRSATGERIGGIGQVYLDNESGEPNWVTVKTGLFGTQESFVPLAQAEVSGVDLTVPYDKATVKDAPRLDIGGTLTPEEERRLYSYYVSARTMQPGSVADHDVAAGTDRDYDGGADQGYDRGDADRDYDRGDVGRDDRGDVDRGDVDRDYDRGDEDDTARPSVRERIANALEPDRDRDDDRTRDYDQGRDTSVGTDRTGDQADTGTGGGSRLRRYVVTEKVVPVSREEVPVDEDTDRR